MHQQSRYLLLDPRATDSDGRVGRDEWWFVIERNWPSGFDQYEHGAWGMFVNFTTSPLTSAGARAARFPHSP